MGDQRDKLKNGLQKLSDTAEQVAEAAQAQREVMVPVQTLVELVELVVSEYKMIIALDRMYTMLVAVVQELWIKVPVVLEEMVVADLVQRQQAVQITQPQLRIPVVVVRVVDIGMVMMHHWQVVRVLLLYVIKLLRHKVRVEL